AHERIALRDGAEVLPADRGVDWLSGVGVPHDRRRTLVGDPHRADVADRDPRRGERRARHPERLLPERGGVVLDPPGPRTREPDLRVRGGDLARVAIEEIRADAGAALVDREDVALRPVHRGPPRSVPGFMMPWGSRARFTASSITYAGPSSRASQSRRTRPIPWWCEIVPPAASVASMAASHTRK